MKSTTISAYVFTITNKIITLISSFGKKRLLISAQSVLPHYEMIPKLMSDVQMNDESCHSKLLVISDVSCSLGFVSRGRCSGIHAAYKIAHVRNIF